MKKCVFLALVLCVLGAGRAPAGQFRIAPPPDLRKRQPPPGRRESRLEIVNRDDRGYAVDVDYRRNRLELQPRSGDMYIPGNSSVTLVFDDDDDWRLYGDHDSLEIEIRAGRTTTVHLETRASRNRIGLFATVEDGRRSRSKQIFEYAERPRQGHPAAHRPAPVPPPQPQQRPQPQPQPPPQPPHGRQEPSRNSTLGSVVGGVVDSLVGNDRPPARR